MKSKMRKIVGVLISATMLLTMTMGVFAAGSSTNGSNGVTATGIEGLAVTAGEQPGQDVITNLAGAGFTLVASYEVKGTITGGSATLTFPVTGATSSSKIAVLHKVNGSWVKESSVAGNGVVSTTVTSLSPFAVVADSSTLSGTTKTGASPKTGESAGILGLGVLALAAVAGVYGLNRKKAYSK